MEPKASQKEQAPCRDHQQQDLLALFGTIDYYEAYDYKSERKRLAPEKIS